MSQHHHRPHPAHAAEPSANEPRAASQAEAAAPELAQQPCASEIQALQAQVALLADQALRAQAEAQNSRRRAEEEIAKSRKFALEAFAESLLPVIDSLEAGLQADSASAGQLRTGTEATLRQLLAALERNKVVQINPEPGARFDPSVQQAISVVPSEQEAGTVAGVLQKGYTIAERVLRPALVTVAAAPPQ
ncbi:MAG: nucleotide exchange factor GrpE [Burkholderiaceae bacterium]|jgi:molecular chaperone GrpE|nr:nucleotide exchange factor GrpE [Burkholderiaceae bacterium]